MIIKAKQVRRVQKIVSVLVVGMTLLGIETVFAEPVVITIDPEVHILEDPNGLLRSLGVSINLGETFSAQYSLDSNAIPLEPGQISGGGTNYFIPPATISANFAGSVISSSGGASIFVGNNTVVINGVNEETDAWQIAVGAFPIGDVNIQMGIIFFDSTATRIDNENFFVNDSLGGWENVVFFMFGHNQILQTSFEMFAGSAIEQSTLFTVIPGINSSGGNLILGAKILLDCNGECLVVRICEADRGQTCDIVNPSDKDVRQMIMDTTKQAMEEGKNIIVNIDMDLENYTWEFPLPPRTNRWDPSVKWGGRMANIVSETFVEENPTGLKKLYSHSAGGNATYQSIKQRRGNMMYDDINIHNGRTNAGKLTKALQASGYEWWQVKVFTSENDLPALPPLPIPFLKKLTKQIIGSISNYDAARESANEGAWVHLHSLEFEGHSGLPNALITGGIGRFDVNLGGQLTDEYIDTVAEMMLKDWRAELE